MNSPRILKRGKLLCFALSMAVASVLSPTWTQLILPVTGLSLVSASFAEEDPPRWECGGTCSHVVPRQPLVDLSVICYWEREPFACVLRSGCNPSSPSPATFTARQNLTPERPNQYSMVCVGTGQQTNKNCYFAAKLFCAYDYEVPYIAVPNTNSCSLTGCGGSGSGTTCCYRLDLTWTYDRFTGEPRFPNKPGDYSDSLCINCLEM